MVLEPGEKVHVITRRRFESDARRHFVGEVTSATESAARVEGWVWVHNKSNNAFEKRSERRTRVFSLVDAGYLINILPPPTDLDNLDYTILDGRLVVTDGKKFRLDIDEFR